MARQFSELISKFQELPKRLSAGMPNVALQVGRRFLAAKLEELATKGVGQYSSKLYAHPSQLKSRALNAAGVSFLDGKIAAKQRTNWKQLRGAQGLPTQFVTLWYSGQMLNSTRVKNEQKGSKIFYFTIGGTNEEARRKLAANRKRYGNFLAPNKEQIAGMNSHVNELVINLIRKALR